MSKNLDSLCYKLLVQKNWQAIENTFQRTYAGHKLKSAGAFSWTIKVRDNKTGHVFLAGSCYPLKDFAKHSIRIDVFTGWKDIELIPEEIK